MWAVSAARCALLFVFARDDAAAIALMGLSLCCTKCERRISVKWRREAAVPLDQVGLEAACCVIVSAYLFPLHTAKFFAKNFEGL